MDTELLQEIGLNKSEAKVYLTLLEIGPSTTGPIMSKAKISSSKIYGVLERLIEKGLVSFIINKKTKYYQGSPPETLLEYFQEKEEKLRQKEKDVRRLVEGLLHKKDFSTGKQEARIFLGWKGVQTAYNSILQSLPQGSEFLGFVSPTQEEERKEVKLFYAQYHRKRVALRYATKLIAQEQSRRVFEQKPYTTFRRCTVRYVDNCPSGLVIFGNNILLIAFEENPVAVIISSKQLAASYRTLFSSMWKMSRC